MSNALQTTQPKSFDLSPQTFEQALTFANYLADSDMVPKDFKGKPGNCLIAMQWGMEIGLKPLQALQNIAVINGRPSLWGDSVIALARNSPACEYIVEDDDGQTATCRVKRRGEAEQIRTFSMDDAKRAGLVGKQGPWTQYPKRMRQMRARAFAIRDVFPDALKGLAVAEEVMDTPSERHMGPAEVVPPAAPTSYPQADFDKNLPSWAKVVASGRKTLADLIAMVGSKAPLTAGQKQALADAVAKLQAGTVEAQTPTAPAATVAAAPTPAPAADAPVVNVEHLAQRLRDAGNHDQLYEAAGLIDAVADEAQQLRLNEAFEARLAELDNTPVK